MYISVSIKKIIYIPAILLMLNVVTTACVKEYHTDCENATIYFQYLADGDKDVLYKYISKVDLFVFDENECLLGHDVYTSEELENFSAKPRYRLEPGKRYKVVAVGNAFEHTYVENIESENLENIYIQDTHWGTSNPVTTHDHNYMGAEFFTMPDTEGTIHHDTVTLYSSHIDVKVRIAGSGIKQPQSRNDMPYTIKIEKSNPQTSFLNRINTELKGTCYPALIYDETNRCYDTDELVLFRMDDEETLKTETCSHELVVTDNISGEEHRFSIYEYLSDNPEIMKKAILQEAILPIEINISSFDVEIKVPDWAIEDVTPEW